MNQTNFCLKILAAVNLLILLQDFNIRVMDMFNTSHVYFKQRAFKLVECSMYLGCPIQMFKFKPWHCQ